MACIMGTVAAVPEARKAEFVAHAHEAWEAIFKPLGAVAAVEAWGDDVPDGEVTSMAMAVKAEPGETVVFSWIEWPGKATYDAANAAMRRPEFAEVVEGMSQMPFDGMRMIWGGFAPAMSERA